MSDTTGPAVTTPEASPDSVVVVQTALDGLTWTTIKSKGAKEIILAEVERLTTKLARSQSLAASYLDAETRVERAETGRKDAEAALVVARTERDEALEDLTTCKRVGAHQNARVGELTTALAAYETAVQTMLERTPTHWQNYRDPFELGPGIRKARQLARVLAGGDDREGYPATILQAYEDGSGLAGGGHDRAEVNPERPPESVFEEFRELHSGATAAQSPGTPSGGERA